MEILFVVFLICLETALLVLTFVRFRAKAQWLQNRTLARAIEFVLLLGITLMPFTHMKFRYTGALILLGVLFLIAGIRWLVRRKKATGDVKKGKIITSTILSAVMILFALAPAFLFTNYNGMKTTGAYPVRTCSAILSDDSRADLFETDGSPREVPVHFYCPDADGSFPLIVFSHGAFGYYQSNYSTYAELASNGYIVASLDHPHHAFFTSDTDGKIVLVDGEFIQNAVDIENGVKSTEEVFAITRDWMRLRTDDIGFVLDTILAAKQDGALNGAWHTEDAATILSVLADTDTAHIGLIGHSMGGAASVSLGRTRSDIAAVIDLDGTMLDEIEGVENVAFRNIETPYPVPVLDICGRKDYSGTEPQDDVYTSVNTYVTAHAPVGKTVVFDGVGHMDFTDLPLFSPFLASMLGSEKIDHEAFLGKVNGLVLNWFDYYLKGTGTLDIHA